MIAPLFCRHTALSLSRRCELGPLRLSGKRGEEVGRRGLKMSKAVSSRVRFGNRLARSSDTDSEWITTEIRNASHPDAENRKTVPDPCHILNKIKV